MNKLNEVNVPYAFRINIERRKWFKRFHKTRGANFLDIYILGFKVGIGMPWLNVQKSCKQDGYNKAITSFQKTTNTFKGSPFLTIGKFKFGKTLILNKKYTFKTDDITDIQDRNENLKIIDATHDNYLNVDEMYRESFMNVACLSFNTKYKNNWFNKFKNESYAMKRLKNHYENIRYK